MWVYFFKYRKTATIFFAVFLIFAGVILPAFFPYFTKTASAAGEQYVFFYNNSDAGTIKSSYNNNALGESPIDNFNLTSVYGQGGAYGNTPFAFALDSTSDLTEGFDGNTGTLVYNSQTNLNCTVSNYPSGFPKFQSDVPSSLNPSSDGPYTLSIPLTMTVTVPESDLTSSKNQVSTQDITGVLSYDTSTATLTSQNGIYEIAAAGQATSINDIINSLSGQQYTTPSDYIPSNCLPSGLDANLGTSPSFPITNYNWLSSAQKSDWPNLQNSNQLLAEGFAANNPTAPGAATQYTCDNSGFGLGWLVCDVISGIAHFITTTYQHVLDPILTIDTSKLGHGSAFYQVWANFRIYGDVLLIIAVLVIVFGESIGGGVIDAYTARKILPRLLAAAVLINLSIYLIIIGIDITNIIGKSIYFLITQPFGAASQNLSGIGLNISDSAGSLILIALGSTLLWQTAVGSGAIHFLFMGIFVPAFLIFVSVLLTVIIRWAIIYILVFVSPIAFALYCLPNTERWFRQWWSLLFRALMVYPIIAAIFAVSNVLSYVLAQQSHLGAFSQVVAIAALFAPLILVPFSFRFAGGIIGQIGQAVQGSVADRAISNIRKSNAERTKRRRAENIARARGGNFIRNPGEKGWKSRINTAAQATSLFGAGGITLNKRQAVKAAMEEHSIAGANEGYEKAAAFQPIKYQDEILAAAIASKGDKSRFMQELDRINYTGDKERAWAGVVNAKREMGVDEFNQAALMGIVSSSTGYRERGAGGLAEDIDMIAGGDDRKKENLIAQTKRIAGQSGRGDLNPAFGAMFQAVDRIHNATPQERARAVTEANDFLHDSIIDTEGPGALVGGRGIATEQLMPSMQRRLDRNDRSLADLQVAQRAVQAGSVTPEILQSMQQYSFTDAQGNQHQVINNGQIDAQVLQQTYRDAERRRIQDLGSVAALNDVLGQVSPEKQRIVANGLMHRSTVHTGGDFAAMGSENLITVGDEISRIRSDPRFMAAFAETHREYSSKYQRDEAQQASRDSGIESGLSDGDIGGGV